MAASGPKLSASGLLFLDSVDADDMDHDNGDGVLPVTPDNNVIPSSLTEKDPPPHAHPPRRRRSLTTRQHGEDKLRQLLSIPTSSISVEKDKIRSSSAASCADTTVTTIASTEAGSKWEVRQLSDNNSSTNLSLYSGSVVANNSVANTVSTTSTATSAGTTTTTTTDPAGTTSAKTNGSRHGQKEKDTAKKQNVHKSHTIDSESPSRDGR